MTTTDPHTVQAFVDARTGNGQEAVWVIEGSAHAQLGDRTVPLFRVRGLDVVRTVHSPTPRGERSAAPRPLVLGRRALFCCNLDGSMMLDWLLPADLAIPGDRTSNLRQVAHQWLDPIIEPGSDTTVQSIGALPGDDELGAQCVVVTFERRARAVNPLSRRRHLDEWSGDHVLTAEFQTITSTPTATLSTGTRIESWWPWLRMGTRPGFVVTHLRGRRYGNPADVPTELRAFIEANRPEFLYAPRTVPQAESNVLIHSESLWNQHVKERSVLNRR